MKKIWEINIWKGCYHSILILFVFFQACSSEKKGLEKAHRQYEAKQFEEAFKSFMPFAQKNNPEAQYCVGVMFYFGIGINQNYEKAFYWFSKSAEQDHPVAQFNLSQMYFEGEGTSKNDALALKWLEKAASHGLPEAQVNLASYYYSGEKVKKDFKKAHELLQKASAQGYPLAILRLGTVYYSGLGVEQDYKQAFKYYEKAANQNLPEAQYMLAKMYFKGKGVEKDEKKGSKLLYLSAKNGCSIAQIVVGLICLSKGKEELANKWFEKARQKEDISQFHILDKNGTIKTLDTFPDILDIKRTLENYNKQIQNPSKIKENELLQDDILPANITEEYQDENNE